MKSIGNKLIIYFSILLFIVCSSMGWFTQYNVGKEIINNTDKVLPQRAVDIGKIIKSQVNEQFTFLEGIASRDRISNPQNSIQDKISILNEAVDESGYLRMGVADVEGNLYLTDTYGVNGQILNVKDRDYFKDSIQGKRAIMDPSISMNADDHEALIIAYAVPIYYNGKIEGSLIAIGDGNFLSNITNKISFGETGYVYMINKEGYSIADKDSSFISNKTNYIEEAKKDKSFESLANAIQRIIENENTCGRYEFKGNKVYYGSSHIEGTNWIVVIRAAEDELLSSIPVLRKNILLITILMLIGGILFAFVIGKSIAKPIVAIANHAQRIANLDVSEDIDKSYINRKDELGKLAFAFESVTNNLRDFIKHVQGSSEQVASSAEELKATSEQSALASEHVATAATEVASHTDKQLNEILNTTSTMEEISASIEEISANFEEINGVSSMVYEKSSIGKEEMNAVMLQMNHIENSTNEVNNALSKITDSSKKINNIVNFIQDISEQTNLLALNAAIEAARAGEAGRGFAVVAEEVRKLAEQAQGAVKGISDLIDKNQSDIDYANQKMNYGLKEVNKGSEAVKGAEQTFGEIIKLITQVNHQIEVMTASISQVAEGSQDIVSSTTQIEDTSKDVAGQIQNVSAATEEQTASMEEISSASESLSELALELQELVKKFKI